MDNLKAIVEKRCALLRKCIQQAEKAAEADVQGHLEIVRHGNKRSFYLVRTPNSKKREYIRKEDFPLVKSLAAKDYAKRVIRRMRSELRVLERYIRCVENGSAEDVYSSLSRTRQILIPDFSLWDKKRRRVIYHEHFGKMDDPVYRKRNLKKIDDYRRNGIFSAKNLIMTFEGEGTSLNMREMRAMIEDLIERS